MKTLISLIALSFTIAYVQASEYAPVDWPQLNGPNQCEPNIADATWLKEWKAKQLWKTNIGTGFSSIAVVGDNVLSMGNTNNTDHVICLSAKDGSEKWRHSYPCKLNPRMYKGGPNATPTIIGKDVFTLSREGHVFCLGLTDGSVKWKRNLVQEEGVALPGFGLSGSPLVIDDVVYLNAGGAGIALNAKTGGTHWINNKSKAGYASPIPFKKNSILIYSEKDVLCLNKKDGKEQWSFPWKTQYGINSPTPLVNGDQILICSGYGKGSALIDVSSGSAQEVWKNKVFECQMSGPIRIGDYAYGVAAYRSKPGELRCVEWKTGKQIWAHGGFGHGSLFALGNKLVVLSEKGQLVLVEANPNAYKELGRQKILNDICWAPPTIANGKVYARDAIGELVCIQMY